MLEASEVLVRAAGLGRRFPHASSPALHPASFEIRPGNRIALVGASGSGKSTLLHLVAGLDAPTAGSIEWPALGPARSLRPTKVAVAFQAPSLVPAFSVTENVALPLFLQNEDGAAAPRIQAALDRFAVGDLADKLPEELSGGQAQRVALARAIVGGPRLLLADEPTGQLDQATGSALIRGLLAWAAEGSRAVVVATHDLAVADAFAEVWRMQHGRLIGPTAGHSA